MEVAAAAFQPPPAEPCCGAERVRSLRPLLMAERAVSGEGRTIGSSPDGASGAIDAASRQRRPRRRGRRLRRTVRGDIMNSIKRCRSVQEILAYLLEKDLLSEKLLPNGIELSDLRADPDVASITLRRVVDLRSISLAKGRRRARARGRKPSETRADSELELNDVDEMEAEAARYILPELLNVVGQAIIFDNKRVDTTFSSFQKKPGELVPTDKLMSHLSLLDTLYSLAKLSEVKRLNKGGHIGQNSGGTGNLQPLAYETCVAINSDDCSFVNAVYHTSLVETVWALAKLNLKNQTRIIDKLGDRLSKPDAVGRLSGKQLINGLWAFAALDRPNVGFMKSSMRRIRKVRADLDPWDIARAMWSVARLVERLDGLAAAPIGGKVSDVEDKAKGELENVEMHAAEMREEAETMCYTLSDDLVKTRCDGRDAKVLVLTSKQVADVLSACASFEMLSNGGVLAALSFQLRQDHVLKDCSAATIARLSLSLEKLNCNRFDVMTMLGKRLNELVKEKKSLACDSKTLNTILRTIALLSSTSHGTTNWTENESFEAATLLLLEDETFLSTCNEFEVSNIAWSFVTVNKAHIEVMLALANRMMEADIVRTCTPSSASRVLWSFTKLLSIVEDGNDDFAVKDAREAELVDKLFELFQSLSGIMLSSQLTPVDCSAAMWAMAKASYPLDMGVFDHLAEKLSEDTMLERSGISVVAKALWAAGRMTEWEGVRTDDIDYYEDSLIPPYVESAKRYATFLLSLKDQMSSRDVAQSIWAIGRLRIESSNILDRFAVVAKEKAGSSNAIEISSILWGLTRLRYDNEEVIRVLTDRFRDPSVLYLASPREISNGEFRLVASNSLFLPLSMCLV